MRILHVPCAYHPVLGGTETLCKRLSETLARQGHDVHVVTTNVGAVQGYYEYGIPKVDRPHDLINGVNVTRIDFGGWRYELGGWVDRSASPAWFAKRIAGRLMRTIRSRLEDAFTTEISRIHPDVVMTMPHLVMNVEAVLAARLRVPFPLVMVPMLHEHDPNWDIDAMTAALRHADAVVALSPFESDRLAEAYEVPREKIFVAPNGIDVDHISQSSSERHDSVIFIGRKVKTKGICELIEAMKDVWAAKPDVELWLAGARVPETVELDRQVSALPARWRERIKDFGQVGDEEKAKLLRSACCLVLPSKIESFGIVILEAWAAATPVVTWDLPVFRSLVEDGQTGVLANPSDGTQALAKAILRILWDKAAAVQMGVAGYKRAAENYSWQMTAETYLKAYEYAVSSAHSTKQ